MMIWFRWPFELPGLRSGWSESQSSSSRQLLEAFRRDPREIAAFGSWKTEEKTGQSGSTRPTKKKTHFEFRSNFWKNIHNQFHHFLLELYHSQHSSRGYIPTYGDDDHSFFGTENAPASRDLTLNNGGYFLMWFDMVGCFRHFFHFIWDVILPIDFHIF